MTVKFVGGPVDEGILQCDWPCERIVVPVLCGSEIHQFVYAKSPDQFGEYLNSPITFIPAEFVQS
jgi:hypothetical protein